MTDVALVFGASGGIGGAVMDTLAASGHAVVGTYRAHRVERWPSIRCDVTDRTAVESAFDLASQHGCLRAVVVATGSVAPRAPLARTRPEALRQSVDINLLGPAGVVAEGSSRLRLTGGGSIVVVSSVAGTIATRGQAGYAAAKAGLAGLIRTAAAEVARDGVRINLVEPGYIDTTMTEGLSPLRRERATGMIPLGRTGRPDEVASVVRFLLSDESSYITGTSVRVDGGLCNQ